MATEADLTAERLTELLAGEIAGAVVTAVRTEPIGTGQMAECLRLELQYSHPGAGPHNVIVKRPSHDPNSRAAAAALRCYEVEVNFYRHLQPILGVRTPKMYYAEIDVKRQDFTLLLEDVAPARQGDQIAGCTFDQAAAAIGELAALHAPLWGHRRLASFEWLHRNTELSEDVIKALYMNFTERYCERLDPAVLDVSAELMDRLGTYVANQPGPWTITHGDFRLDNLLFFDAGPDHRVFVVDWQTAVCAPGISDVSYFLGGALPTEQRRTHEKDLLRAYHERLRAAGIELTWGEVWSQYRRYAFGGLLMAIAASMLVKRTPRGDDMFVMMAQRHGHHAIDLEASSFIE